MKHAFALGIVLLFMVPHGAFARECVMEIRDFDYMETSPQEFMRGTPDQVKSAYRAMLDHVGDPDSVRQATQYFVDSEQYATITSRECSGEFCRGRDVLYGEMECAQQTGVQCLPLAAIKDGTIYCTLKPTYEYGQPPLRPFE